MDREIELTWACTSCHHRNRGRDMKCVECGSPKDDSESYEMPIDTRAEASVTDPALLKLAAAGPNWICSFCGSDQRRDDGTCGNCGASVQARVADLPLTGSGPPPVPELLTWWQRWGWQQKAALAAAAGAIVIAFAAWLWVHRERDYRATVAQVTWTQTIHVERYQVWERSGWRLELPEGAFDVVSKGQQLHHVEHVLDGYTTEHYTEQVACGQDCRTSSPVCHEVCTNSRNGFASCHEECSGGGTSCTPRWCTESRTRETPRYHDEPRYAEAVGYKVWDWGDVRSVSATGFGITGMRWPTEEAKIGDKERERREASYQVTIEYNDDKQLSFPVSRSRLDEFAVGSKHVLKIDDERVQVGRYLVEPIKK